MRINLVSVHYFEVISLGTACFSHPCLQFVIRASGSTIWNEEAGKPVQRKGRIVWKNSAFLLDFENDDDRLWRLSMNGGALHLDFYQPKATYPKGPPRDQGTGVNTAAASR